MPRSVRGFSTRSHWPRRPSESRPRSRHTTGVDPAAGGRRRSRRGRDSQFTGRHDDRRRVAAAGNAGGKRKTPAKSIPPFASPPRSGPATQIVQGRARRRGRTRLAPDPWNRSDADGTQEDFRRSRGPPLAQKPPVLVPLPVEVPKKGTPQKEEENKPDPEPAPEGDPKTPPKKGGFTTSPSSSTSRSARPFRGTRIAPSSRRPLRRWRMLDPHTNKVVATMRNPVNRLTAVRRAVLSADAQSCSSPAATTAAPWSLRRRHRRSAARFPSSGKLGNSVVAAAMSSDGRWIVSATREGPAPLHRRTEPCRGPRQSSSRRATRLPVSARPAHRAHRRRRRRLAALERRDRGDGRGSIPFRDSGARWPSPALTCTPRGTPCWWARGNNSCRFNLKTGELHKSSTGHAATMAGVAFSADGSLEGGVDEAGNFTIIHQPTAPPSGPRSTSTASTASASVPTTLPCGSPPTAAWRWCRLRT